MGATESRPGGIRTPDPRIKSPLLYQLSYEPIGIFDRHKPSVQPTRSPFNASLREAPLPSRLSNLSSASATPRCVSPARPSDGFGRRVNPRVAIRTGQEPVRPLVANDAARLGVPLQTAAELMRQVG